MPSRASRSAHSRPRFSHAHPKRRDLSSQESLARKLERRDLGDFIWRDETAPGYGSRAVKSSWGGARAGAGRPAKHAIASEPHKQRPALSARHPVHVVARVAPKLRAFGSRRTWRAVERAVARSLARTDFRIVHVVLARRRLELVV